MPVPVHVPRVVGPSEAETLRQPHPSRNPLDFLHRLLDLLDMDVTTRNSSGAMLRAFLEAQGLDPHSPEAEAVGGGGMFPLAWIA